MTEPQTQTPHSNIDWLKSFGNLALAVWGSLTYFALLGGVAWLAAATAGPKPMAIALMAVLCTTTGNWVLIAAIDRHVRD